MSSGVAASAAAVDQPSAQQCDNNNNNNKAIHPSVKYEQAPISWCQRVAGVGFVLSVVCFCYVSMVIIVIPTKYLLQPVFGKDFYRRVHGFVEGLFYPSVFGAMEFLHGMQFVVTCEPDEEHELVFSPKDMGMMICNHRTEVDYMFFWNLAVRFGLQENIRVMLKSQLRHVPVIGWSMVVLNFPYVDRNWIQDQARLQKLLKLFKDYATGTLMAMFPEGTSLCDYTLEKSHAFEANAKAPLWNYVLYPRTKGFVLCMNELDPDWVLDVTIGFPDLCDGVRPSPIRFLRGQFPSSVHMHVRKFSRKTLAGCANKETWLLDRFADKEKLLCEFYENGGRFVNKKHLIQSDAPAKRVMLLSALLQLVLCAAMCSFFWSHPRIALAWCVITTVAMYQEVRQY